MKNFLLYILFAILFLIFPSYSYSQLEGMLDQQQLANLADRIAQVGKKRIAVVDFTDLQGNVTELGRFLAEEFSVALVGAGKGFEVIDRVHLKSILAEHKLALTGVIDPKTARQLGKIAGVDAILTGSITPFGDSIRLSIKVLDTETAMIIAASSGNIPKTKAIEELLAKDIDTRTQGTGPAVESTTLAKSEKIKSDAGKIVQAHNFTFELKECKMSGTNITCNLLITNNDQDRELRIYGHYKDRSRMFDESGKLYPAESILIGNIKKSDPRLLIVSV